MKLINLTGHEVHELDHDLKIPASETKFRVTCTTTEVTKIKGVPVYRTELKASGNIPDPQDGVVYIVSALALNVIPKDRIDIVSPKQVIRNSEGNIIGCKGFRCN